MVPTPLLVCVPFAFASPAFFHFRPRAYHLLGVCGVRSRARRAHHFPVLFGCSAADLAQALSCLDRGMRWCRKRQALLRITAGNYALGLTPPPGHRWPNAYAPAGGLPPFPSMGPGNIAAEIR